MISSLVRSSVASIRGSLPSPRAIASSVNSRGARRYSTEKPSRQALWPRALHGSHGLVDPTTYYPETTYDVLIHYPHHPQAGERVIVTREVPAGSLHFVIDSPDGATRTIREWMTELSSIRHAGQTNTVGRIAGSSGPRSIAHSYHPHVARGAAAMVASNEPSAGPSAGRRGCRARRAGTEIGQSSASSNYDRGACRTQPGVGSR